MAEKKKKPKKWLLEKTLEELVGGTATEPTRISHYDFYMLYWIMEFTDQKSPALVKKLMRGALMKEYDKHRTGIEELQESRRNEARIKASAATDDDEQPVTPPPPKPKKK